MASIASIALDFACESDDDALRDARAFVGAHDSDARESFTFAIEGHANGWPIVRVRVTRDDAYAMQALWAYVGAYCGGDDDEASDLVSEYADAE